ncbi:preQ(0) biosynthesis protein QueD [Dethiosulfatibacter aminovorans DSM 17477]|uniref:6-carboxy-5,6,7,8-tetrahydropterin synthase n=1 Tax=Dethiosulfatibacter aminovorans DSM 17477 TaxID=1121476 RepID=A0A1M6AS51_9FIRM|nr:6-carboxytetrahydropterin synthase QueD [Dethiosulfatibacter aminovorans]SHI39158.1 preQ(0) biosynthesis protein QueD [Dethiosulfatibacter aminovorans DSM 17477]
MYLLKAEHSFDSAHFLAGYDGKCSNIHGHRWTVEVEIQSENLVADGKLKGMIVDFSELKEDVKELVNDLDHALIIQKDTMRKETLNCLVEDGFKMIEVDFRPTAENFSFHFFSEMEKKGYDVKRTRVYETPNNSAVYEK